MINLATTNILPLFQTDYLLENQLKSWAELSPKKMKRQRNVILLYLEVHPLSTYYEISTGLKELYGQTKNVAFLMREPSVVRALSYLCEEAPCLLDTSHKKGNACAYQLNEVGMNEVKILKVKK